VGIPLHIPQIRQTSPCQFLFVEFRYRDTPFFCLFYFCLFVFSYIDSYFVYRLIRFITPLSVVPSIVHTWDYDCNSLCVFDENEKIIIRLQALILHFKNTSIQQHIHPKSHQQSRPWVIFSSSRSNLEITWNIVVNNVLDHLEIVVLFICWFPVRVLHTPHLKLLTIKIPTTGSVAETVCNLQNTYYSSTSKNQSMLS